LGRIVKKLLTRIANQDENGSDVDSFSKDRVIFKRIYLDPALADGLIEMTIPDKPTSRLQKYRLTEKGRKLLENSK